MPFRFRTLTPLAVAAGLGFVPVAALVWGLHGRAVARGERRLAAAADTLSVRCDRLVADADAVLTRLAADTDGDPPEKLLRRAEYLDPRFREFGVLDPAGRLVRTNFGPVLPPLPVAPSDAADPAHPNTQVVGLRKTSVMGEWSILVGRPTGVGRGTVNVLIDPGVFTFLVDDAALGDDGFLAVTLPDGRLLATVPARSPGPGVVSDSPDPGRLRVDRVVAGGRLRVVAEADRGAFTAGLPRDAAWVGLPVWLTTAGVVLWAARRRRAGLADDIRIGLGRGEFAVVYQPIVDLETYRWTGLEALLRWTHPGYGPVRPDVFIPMAEQAGLVGRLSEWLIDRAAVELADVFRRLPDLYLSVNLPPELVADGTAGTLAARAERAGLPMRRLKFEITERSLPAGSLERLAVEVGKWSAAGVRFALDDFGVGYANYAQLSQVKFDAVKLDRSLIAERGDGMALAVLDTMLSLTRRMNVRMVAEGVETDTQADHLRAIGVPFAQGWLFGRPMPATELLSFHASAGKVSSSPTLPASGA
jgi:EAL domain-containing protein (putative c-di-GMP-specific phosphodiesterase class I)